MSCTSLCTYLFAWIIKSRDCWVREYESCVKLLSLKCSSGFFFFFCLFLFRAAPTPLGGSHDTGLNRSCNRWPMPQPQQHRIWAVSVIYTTAHGNLGSLTHWVRPGIKPTSSWMLVRFINRWAMRGTPKYLPVFIATDTVFTVLRLSFVANTECYPSFTLWYLESKTSNL